MAMVASFVTVGGQLLMPGVAALCRNWPGRDDWQVLQIVIISPFVLMLPYVWWVPLSEEFHNAGRVGWFLKCWARRWLVQHTVRYTEQHTLTNNALFLLSFVFPPLLFCLCPSLCALFPSFLSPSEGFSLSPCAGCWPPSTTGGLRPWCFASPGRTRLTWQPNQVEFLQVRKFSRRVQTNPNHLAINVYFLLLYIFQYAYHLNSVLYYCCFSVCDEMNMQWTLRHCLT